MDWLKKYLEWFVSAAVGALICAGVVAFEAANYESPVLLRMLCDGAFISGVLLTGFGALVLVGAEGAFDAMGFIVHTLVRKFSPRKDRFRSRMTYLAYKEQRREKPRRDLKCVFVTGVAFLAVAGLCLALYY